MQGIDLKGVPQSNEVREKTEKESPPSFDSLSSFRADSLITAGGLKGQSERDLDSSFNNAILP